MGLRDLELSVTRMMLNYLWQNTKKWILKGKNKKSLLSKSFFFFNNTAKKEKTVYFFITNTLCHQIIKIYSILAMKIYEFYNFSYKLI